MTAAYGALTVALLIIAMRNEPAKHAGGVA
jgi:hypothetical protein